ncbi:MAG TPA: S8 family serine peptidase, partial [Verrucomicrobiota bacterium]|nr:S8 family serine peptidase [Verrucomicrobiota bacterium]
GAVIGNNSWGDDVNGRYDVSAAEFDELVRDANFLEPGDQPYILEFSAGNAGPSARTIGTPALAKNVIATGASLNNRDDLFIYTEGQETMADFSSRGPCEDGRIKPDVVAPGTWIASLRSIFADDNNAWAEISQNYMYQGGTSQSGPHVSGAAAVFVQYYRENFGGTPSPALVKAALINSAVDMLDEFGTAPAPNNEEGWGRIDLTRIIDSDRDVVFIEQTNVLSTGASYETAVVVEDPSEPLKVTLTYTDEPGFPGAIPALVNDLDLEVIAPDGTLYRGNRFSNGESIPNAATPDNINNVEGVFLFEPLVGEYRIRVFARNVPEDARIDTPAVDQDFALVISGAFLPPGQSVVYLDRTYYRVPDRIHVGVVDRDRAGSPFVSVTLTSTTEPGGQNLLLFPETPNGVFTNSIVTATGAPAADNQLQIAHGDLIQARYQDDSTGALRIASAEADLVPPIISAVTVTNRFGRATILWNTDELTDSRVDYGTTAALGLSTGDLELTTSHTIGLENLIPLATYFFQVVSKDRAGNVTTNNNGGAMYSLVAPAPPPVLIVDGFYDDLLLAPAPPLSEYTNTLNQLGVSYDVWDHRNQGSPELADLRPYRVVMWRVAEFSFTYPTFTEEEQQTIREYLNAGGSLFVASMEVLSRLDELGGSDGPAFRRDILKVPSLVVDAELPSVSGVPGDLIGDGLHFVLDHPPAIFGSGDFSDTIVPSGDAVGILTDDVSDGFAGLRYPRVGVDSPWRLVFLPFLLEAIPANGTPPNTRAEFLNRVLQFLAPGFNGVAVVTLDRAAYGLPSEMIVEVGDADVAGAGQITVTALSTTEPAGKTFVLEETPRPGLFRGLIPILSSTNPPSADYLRANPNDLVTVRFFDSSSGKNVEDTAVIDIVTPQIFDVGSEPDYSTAIIYWETDEASDSLVQFGESLPLPINRTEFDPTMTLYHEVTLAGLQPDRSYYYQVVSRDSAGNAVIDNNGGQYYTFTTLKPLTPPLMDTFETGATNWSVFSNDESETQWALGVPRNGVETAAHSPTNAWGSSLRGRPASLVDTFLISPAIHLTNGNVFTLRFWHSYDFSERSQFDLLEGGEILLVESDGNRAIALATYFDGNFEWEEEEIDLSQYSGKVIYLVWHHVLLSFDFLPRPGWLVDDVQILVDNIVPGTVTVTNNLSQASFILTGPTSRNGVGRWLQITNAPPGQYVVTFGNVPYCFTPPSQTNTLAPGGTLVFNGVYSFPDANANGISDLWEQAFFGGAAPTDDPDGDAASNYAEFMAGTNPTNSASRLGLSVSKQPNNLIRLEWPASPGRAYRLLSSTNMTVWTPGEWTRASGSAMSSLLPAPQAPTFYRVEVQP